MCIYIYIYIFVYLFIQFVNYRYDQAELDKEVGKRDFLFDIITYPYAGTINFKICFDVNQE